MLKIGVTGSIASGKSTWCKTISDMFDVPVYYMDIRSKMMFQWHGKLQDDMEELLGEQIYNEDGTYNTKYVASIVFSDVEKRKKIESLFSEYLKKDYADWVEIQENKGYEYILMESAILFEVGSEEMVDFVVGIKTHDDIRLWRLMERNGFSLKEARTRMNAQMDQAEKMALCDYVVNNEHAIMVSEIERLNRLFRKIAKIMKK